MGAMLLRGGERVDLGVVRCGGHSYEIYVDRFFEVCSVERLHILYRGRGVVDRELNFNWDAMRRRGEFVPRYVDVCVKEAVVRLRRNRGYMDFGGRLECGIRKLDDNGLSFAVFGMDESFRNHCVDDYREWRKEGVGRVLSRIRPGFQLGGDGVIVWLGGMVREVDRIPMVARFKSVMIRDRVYDSMVEMLTVWSKEWVDDRVAGRVVVPMETRRVLEGIEMREALESARVELARRRVRIAELEGKLEAVRSLAV